MEFLFWPLTLGGTHEIVSDGFNGMLIPEQSSAEDIAASILQFLNMNDEDYSLMRAAARKQWKTKFQTNCNARILIDALFSPQISLMVNLNDCFIGQLYSDITICHHLL